MSKHTPGPWSVAPRTARYQVIPATEKERLQLESINAIEFEALSVGTSNGQMAMIPLDESNRANANLIAAAPDLLEALEEAISMIDMDSNISISSPMAIRWKEAAAKARGEQ